METTSAVRKQIQKSQFNSTTNVNSEQLIAGRKNYLEGCIRPMGRSLPIPALSESETKKLNNE